LPALMHRDAWESVQPTCSLYHA